ncbi:MAG: DegV family protein [Clostridia bacterium]|nr:DegV family protein [Clostridia bacterium]
MEIIMSDIKIVVDNSADMPAELAKKYDIGVINFLSIFGEDAYESGVNMTNDEFYDMLEQYDGVPTTSQTPYAVMYDYFLDEARKHKSVIYFTISAKASGQYNTMHLVRDEILEEYPEADIHIVDSEKFSLYITSGAVEAAKAAEDGKSVDEVIDIFLKEEKKWRCYLLVDTLEYLKKGGRVSKATAFVGGLLDIKPILTIEHGLVESMDKLRGNKKLITKLIDKIKDDPDFDSENPEFLVVQSDEEKGQKVIAELEDEFDEGCVRIYSEFGPIVGTHVGRGAFAIICKIK